MTLFKSGSVKTEIRRAVRERPLFKGEQLFHDENGDTLLREDYRETREKAQELKDLADFGYAGLFGKGQTKVTTEIIER